MQFKAGVKVFIVPGAHKMKNNFDYIRLYEILQKMKYIVEVIHLPATFGFITVKKDSITIGLLICKEEIRTVPLITKNQNNNLLKEGSINENNFPKNKVKNLFWWIFLLI